MISRSEDIFTEVYDSLIAKIGQLRASCASKDVTIRGLRQELAIYRGLAGEARDLLLQITKEDTRTPTMERFLAQTRRD